VQAHFGPTENHRKYSSAESGSNGSSVAQEPKQIQLRQAVPQLLDKRKPRQAQPPAVGGGWSRGQAGRPPSRPPGPWAPPPQLCHMVLPHWLPKSVLQGRAAFPGWLPPINTRGGGKEWNTHTHHTLSTHLSPLEFEAFILDA